MDDQAFDRLAKSVAAPSRRTLLKGAVGAFFGGTLAVSGLSTVAAAGRPGGSICRKNGDCASGVCGPKDGTGRQRCGCATEAECPAPADACSAATCTAGVCGIAPSGTCACTVCPAGQTLLSNGTCGTPCTSEIPDGSCGNRCVTTSDGNFWAVGGTGTGGCSGTNLSCPVGSGCSGTVCERICGWAGECGTVICSQANGEVQTAGC